MPKQVQYTKEIIINAAVEILRSSGIEVLTARSLSKKLGCSVAPLFHTYANMEELTLEVRKAAGKIVSDYLADAVNYEPAFKEYHVSGACKQATYGLIQSVVDTQESIQQDTSHLLLG